MSEANGTAQAVPKFCDQCGLSLIPLSTPHVGRECTDCGKTAYFVNPGEDGKGIKVEKGDTFTIPAGWLTMSLDPAKSKGRFSRHGLNWFVESILKSVLPASPAEVKAFLDRVDKQVDEILASSKALPGIDPNSQEDMARVFEQFNNNQDTVEWHALLLAAFRHQTLEKLEDEEASKEEVAFLLAYAMTEYAMVVYKRDLESHVWSGYEQTQQVYDVVTATAGTPTEARAIEALRPAFAKLSEEVLAAWVDSGVDISEKLGISNIDAKVVNALAKFHLAQFDRKRQNDVMLKEARGKRWGIIAAGASAGAAIATAIIGLLAYLGVFSNPPSQTPARAVPSVSSQARSSPSVSSRASHR